MRAYPLQRSLAAAKAGGFEAGITERFIPHRNIRIDLYGFIDALWIKPNQTVAVQACRQNHLTDHRKTILSEPRARLWLEAGCCPNCGTNVHSIELHGVAQRSARPLTRGQIGAARKRVEAGESVASVARHYEVGWQTMKTALTNGHLPPRRWFELQSEPITLEDFS